MPLGDLARPRTMLGRPTRALALLFAATALPLAGCGSSENSDPNVSGTWTLAIPSFSGGGVTCTMSGVTMTVVQPEKTTTFSGTHSTGTFTCAAGGQSDSRLFDSGPIVNGTLAGTTVAFDLDDSRIHFQGAYNEAAGQMSGTVTFQTTTPLTGSWTASRQGGVASIAPVTGHVGQSAARALESLETR